MTRRFKFDRGDWVARRDHGGEWHLVGKVIDADSDSCTVESSTGVRHHYVPGEDRISRIRWRRQGGRSRWELA